MDNKKILENRMTLDSREVAEMIGKEHKNLLRDITRYSNYFNGSEVELVNFFQENQYLDSKGEKRRCYRITRKGCEFLAHKLTGRKGSIFTALDINRFYKYEKLKEVLDQIDKIKAQLVGIGGTHSFLIKKFEGK